MKMGGRVDEDAPSEPVMKGQVPKFRTLKVMLVETEIRGPEASKDVVWVTTSYPNGLMMCHPQLEESGLLVYHLSLMTVI
jgi:hypothetical protein